MPRKKQVKETKTTYAARAPRKNGARRLHPRVRQQARSPERRVLGKYIVADPEICHGKVTFIGTRIFVSDVLEMVAEEMPWDEILHQWHGHISKEAIAEAVLLARDAFMTFVDKPQNHSLEL